MNSLSSPASSLELDESLLRAFGSLAAHTCDVLAVAEYPAFRLLQINPAGRAVLGLTPEENLSALALADFLSPQLLSHVWLDLTHAPAPTPVWSGEAALTPRGAAQARTVRLAASLLPASGPRGECLALAATCVDRAADPEVLQDHRLLHALLEHIPDSLYFKDRQSRFLRVSHRMAKNIGYAPDEIVGHSDFDYFSHELANNAFADEQRIIDSRTPVVDLEEKETWADGHVTWVSTWKMPLLDGAGAVIGTFGMSRDITARKEAEQKLQVAQKELLEASRLAGMAEIASGVLHNIGNALNSVNTSVALVAEQLNRSRLGNLAKAVQLLEANQAGLAAFLTHDPRGRQLPGYLQQLSGLLAQERDTFQREIDQLRRSIEHIKDIVAMQQNYARVSGLTDDAVPAEMVEEALHISAMSLSRHGINVVRDFAPVPKVHVTRHKVLQILVNLIRNAKYAMDETGRTDKEMIIRLAGTPEGRVQFVVRDNGAGIAPEHLTKIFSFGFTTRKEGHGFGLHSSANAARELGGTIAARSDGPGRGAEFILELPPAPSATASSEAAPSPESAA